MAAGRPLTSPSGPHLKTPGCFRRGNHIKPGLSFLKAVRLLAATPHALATEVVLSIRILRRLGTTMDFTAWR